MAQTREQKAVIKRWVKALKSGEYEQGRGALVKTGPVSDKFCCLGVLCDMAVRAKVIEVPTLPAEPEDRISYKNTNSSLPQAVMDWAGIRTNYGKFDRSGSRAVLNSLANMNDNGMTFTQIAEIIESNPVDLFV